jgi:hypothetical protein
MGERTPEEIVSGLLQVSVGDTVKTVPTLPIKHVPEWARLLDALTPSTAKIDPRDGFTAIATVTMSAFLDLVVAYDRTGALGGREWLEEHADAQQLKAAAVQMAENAFPLGDGASVVAQMIATMLVPLAAASNPTNSTNGASRNGASPRKRSARSSTRSS